MTLYEFLLGSQPILDAMGHLAAACEVTKSEHALLPCP